MRKLIAAASLGCILSFAIALINSPVNAEDSAANPQSSTGYSTSTTTTQQDTTSTAPDMSQKSETSKAMKTCRDESGTQFKRGESGFEKCMDEMKRRQEQMGGEAKSAVQDKMNSIDSSTSSTSGSSDTSSTH